MTNNDIFKKLRVALQLRDDQIVDILQLVDFRISKGEIGNFFRNADHPKFVECGDQVLRNFLNRLVIYLRGTKDDPKNPMELIESNRAAAKTAGKSEKPTKSNNKPHPAKTAAPKKTTRPASKSKPRTPIVENVRFNNGKSKNSKS